METSLHRSLKERYGTLGGGRCEVAVAGFRIDAVAEDGTLIEIQSAGLGNLKPKLRRLLPHHRVRVIRPIVLRRVVVRREHADGPDLSRRRSPKLGSLVDAFDDLVGLASLLPDRNLSVELLGVTIEEIRVSRRRRPGFAVVDRRLDAVVDSVSIVLAADLWNLLPLGFPTTEPFTTADLARKLGRSLPFAQRVAYCLRLAGAVETVGKRGNSLIYEAQDDVVLMR
ncbi:hypothetical protein [Paludisphaera mucosa]|uniref:DUF8091 domain-containing protein n=1 Tax=Paludisphaera mucosa TaxID=3030827 RepID=A0ABT6FDF2_9BACT|nr:hypothetical protein [Paludisphaera mucosa]MDG3005596.1 hypothetical protein [Paludisphaera mucosa]